MRLDYAIIGGGIVGLSTAFRFQTQYPHLRGIVIEKKNELAKHQTGHNSGVIHSGIYYKPGSLKAKNCITGYNELLAFCRDYGIPFERCGKIIVATEQSELPRLDNLFERGLQNGLTEIKKISGEEIRGYEPHARGVEAIVVPYTGIVDFKRVALKYAELFQNAGGTIALGEKVVGLREKTEIIEIETSRGVHSAKVVLNCAGLHSDAIASLSGAPVETRIIPFRGEYYEIKKERQYLVKNLIYPVPDPSFPFLGVHFTRRITGGIEAGPNAVLALRREGYKKTDLHLKDLFDIISWPGFRKIVWRYWRTGLGEYYRSFSKAAFSRALQKLVPEITEDDLIPGGSGVRAQACDKAGNLLDDFYIINQGRMIHLCNAPSPGATASLALGEELAGRLIKALDGIKSPLEGGSRGG